MKKRMRKKKSITLQHHHLGSLNQIADSLWEEMQEEIRRNGCSDLTLCMEGSVRGIYDIIQMNRIKEIV